MAPALHLIGSERHLKQLITILLDNAVKYAGENGRALLLARQEQDRALITINNTGEAINPEELQHIFERFYRVDKSRARRIGGYGLWLSIALNIVHMHRGSIRCESSRAEGTTFIVELPMK